MRAQPRSRRLSWTEITPPVALVALLLRRGVGTPAPSCSSWSPWCSPGRSSPPCTTRKWSRCASGEPFGSLVLAVAVTVIEVALILTLMVSGGKDTSVLARDTVFAAVMITCNGIVGALPAGRSRQVRHHPLQRRGHGGRPGHGDHARDDLPRAAELHHVDAGSGVHRWPARVRRGGLAAAVPAVRGHPDSPAPGLLPACHLRGRAAGGGARGPSDRPAHPDEPRLCSSPRWWRWSGWRRSSRRRSRTPS